jgi:WD40 repeat protein
MRIVTASDDNTARIWDAATGNEIRVLRGHEGRVWSAAFSRDGTRIVTASGDKTARIWDAATGNKIKVLRGHESVVRSAAFSPDGTRVVTASDDKTARISDVHFATMSTKGLLAETCGRRLLGISTLRRDDMRLLGYSDDQPQIDVCEGIQ